MPDPENRLPDPAGLLSRAEAFVRTRLEANACGHDFHHIDRVRALALRIAPSAGADPFLTELAALLHDVADPKLNDTPDAGRRELAAFLDACGLAPMFRARLEDVLERVSFGRELDGHAAPKSPELQAVQDADRLDALGAIGIARTFAYGGNRGQAMHDPELPAREGLDQAAYRGGRSTSVNHFHEKLFRLKDRMNTRAGRDIAEERHRYMAGFLDRFMAEWEGLA
jgi:uncharacterized protein